MHCPTQIKFTIYTLLFVYVLSDANEEDYKRKRAKLFRDEALFTLGGNITLTDNESIVNNCLMQHKFYETDYSFRNSDYFNFSRHFFSYKDDISKSKVYQIIRDIPKGAVLHVHDMAILGPDYLLNLTYKDNLYVCFESNIMKLKFAAKTPLDICDGQWQLMSSARQSSDNVTKFDSLVRKHFTLVVDNPDVVYPTITETWTAFMKYFTTVLPLLSYRPLWEQYFYDVLKKFRDDNIMYVEVRSILPNLYELDGTTYEPIVTAKTYRRAIHRFVKDYPDFIGAKLIYAPSRNIDTYKLESYLKLAKEIKDDVPEIFAGFDLVGQEDKGGPLFEFVPQLLSAAKDFHYFFHAGETDWYGTMTDENLADAILLGAKRIGHAYALPKHPLLMREVVDKDIGLEVNVISNAVLSLVHDIRNHPLSIFLSHDLPVVISSDDPGAWEADSISDDFYVAFVGVASRLSDLRLLKKLASNSIKYSALIDIDKDRAMNVFNTKWNEFINNFNCSYYQ